MKTRLLFLSALVMIASGAHALSFAALAFQKERHFSIQYVPQILSHEAQMISPATVPIAFIPQGYRPEDEVVEELEPVDL